MKHTEALSALLRQRGRLPNDLETIVILLDREFEIEVTQRDVIGLLQSLERANLISYNYHWISPKNTPSQALKPSSATELAI